MNNEDESEKKKNIWTRLSKSLVVYIKKGWRDVKERIKRFHIKKL